MQHTKEYAKTLPTIQMLNNTMNKNTGFDDENKFASFFTEFYDYLEMKKHLNFIFLSFGELPQKFKPPSTSIFIFSRAGFFFRHRIIFHKSKLSK